MATISTFVQAAGGKGNPGPKAYMVEREVNLVTEAPDPSAADVLQVLTVPADTMILSAGLEVIEVAVQNTGTDATADVGTSTDDDEWVAAFDIDGASVGDYAPVAAAATTQMDGVANTLDLTFAGTGASFTAGKLRVFALLMDVGSSGSSKTADEVDRDTLA
tara:strand:- start:5492 stop:5977 length:486 start_codon:yes stop_codon:yes gene_type:complete